MDHTLEQLKILHGIRISINYSKQTRKCKQRSIILQYNIAESIFLMNQIIKYGQGSNDNEI